MKCCRAFPGLLTVTSLLLPLWAPAESQLQVGPQSGKVSAAAHVDFRIVVPQVLSLGLMGGDARATGACRAGRRGPIGRTADMREVVHARPADLVDDPRALVAGHAAGLFDRIARRRDGWCVGGYNDFVVTAPAP